MGYWWPRKVKWESCLPKGQDRIQDVFEPWRWKWLFIRPWNEQARTKQKEQKNERKKSDLIGLSNGYERAWRLVGSTNARLKKIHARRTFTSLHFDVILQHHWSIEQCLLRIRVFFGGKKKSPTFHLFIHWLIKQITNTYRNHFSMSYENRCKTHFHKVLHLASFSK